jgi:hypothetical protein
MDPADFMQRKRNYSDEEMRNSDDEYDSEDS